MTAASVLSGEQRWHVDPGDCLDGMRALPDRGIDVVITDPPYSAHVHASVRRAGRTVDLGFRSLDPAVMHAAAREFARLCRRWVIVFCDIESAHLWGEALVGRGLEHVRTGAWIRQGCMPQITGDRPAVGFEAIVIAHRPGRKRWNGGGTRGVWTHAVQGRSGGAESERVHTTQKPLELMLELAELFSDADEVVLDPFAGSGTTGVACLRLGRRFLGFELDETYARTARERCAAEEAGSTLVAARTGQLALLGGDR